MKVSMTAVPGGAAAANIGLRDGVTIFVPRASLVFVLGDVKTPGSYPIRQDTSVLQALALAGGATPTAALNRLKVIRVVGGEKKELSIKVTEPVQPGDTIVVPRRYF
jgi:polysaccharide export outer membrane protein